MTGECVSRCESEWFIWAGRLGQERAAAVKGAMQFIWQNYKSHAWGADELKPKSGTPNVCGLRGICSTEDTHT